MEKINIKKLNGVKCPHCEDKSGYFIVEEGITWFRCVACRFSMRAKHYRDKMEEKI